LRAGMRRPGKRHEHQHQQQQQEARHRWPRNLETG
jgi:hypothetical protein